MRKGLKQLAALGLTVCMVLQGFAVPSEKNGAITAEAAAMSTQRVSVHDPSIVKDGNNYYLFGTHLGTATSKNLTSWSAASTNLDTDYASVFSQSATWAKRGSSSYDLRSNLWAPDVIYNPTMGKWCMYMSVNGDNYYSSIALATADKITGPYKYAGTIVYSGFTNSTEASATDYAKVMGTNTVASRYVSNGKWNSSYGTNAIDPCVLYDANGDLWMSYGSWFGGIYMLKLDKNTGLRDYTYKYSTTTNSSDQYMGKKISGGYGGTGEGSYIVYDKDAGYYYLYLSYCGPNATDSFSGYHMRLFRSKNITGPYTDAAGNSAIRTSSSDSQKVKGIKLFGNYSFSSLSGNNELSSNGYMSGGHNSAMVDTDGSRYLFYHTRFNTGNEFHQVRVHQQFLNQDNWPVTAVYEYLGSKISKTGYSKSDMVGTYQFVNHGNEGEVAAYTGMLPTLNVSLNSNGTISGDVTGTWSYTSGTYYCQMVIGGVTYKGVFFKQYDESNTNTEVMTFSLIGNNNQSIWGSKVSNNENASSSVNTSAGASTENMDGVYYIENVFSGLYLDIENGSTADGANVRQWSYNGSQAQKFKLVSDGNGYYSILTGATNYTGCVDITNGSAEDGANVEQWTHWGGDMQKFEIVHVGGGQYAIKTKCSSGKSGLDVYAWSTEAGGNINQWNYWGGECQLWYLKAAEASTAYDGTYYLQSKSSGLYLDVENGSNADGANIQQWEYNGCDAQKFKFVADGKGDYYILTGASGYTKCLDIYNGGTADGTNVDQWTYWGGKMQKYHITKVGNYIAIRSANNNYKSCLDVYGWSNSNGGNIGLWNYWAGDCQLFKLIKTN